MPAIDFLLNLYHRPQSADIKDKNRAYTNRLCNQFYYIFYLDNN